MRKKKRKLWLQALSVTAIFYIVSMILGTLAMYYSSRSTYLTAKNDMMQRDLAHIKSVIEERSGLSWFLSYSKDHVDEIRQGMTTDDMVALSELPFVDSQNPEKTLDSFNDEQKLLYAKDVYSTLWFMLDSQFDNYDYISLWLMDISEEDPGFIYYEAKPSTEAYNIDLPDYDPSFNNNVLGDRRELKLDDHPAIGSLRSGDFEDVAFEIAPSDVNNSGNNYTGYIPLTDCGTHAVIGIDYNWDAFHSELLTQIRFMIGIMFIGMIISAALMMFLVNRIAIRPLAKVQHTVREYIRDKDMQNAMYRLDKITSKNEIGVLADDVTALIREIHEYTTNIKTLTKEVMEALAHTIDAKDRYTNGHSFRVAMYSRMLALELGLSRQDQEDIYYMGLLHDIGKIGIPNSIINKPDRLTDEEFEIVKKHPVYGYEILSEIKSMPALSTGARYHHERYDGKGYPDGLKGEQIPFLARIIAVADSYDTMTSNRSYRKYLPQDVVRSEIEKNIGTQFDPAPAEAMLKIIDKDKNYMLHE